MKESLSIVFLEEYQNLLSALTHLALCSSEEVSTRSLSNPWVHLSAAQR